MNNQFSPYYKTPITDLGYLDILQPQAIPRANDDVLYEITSAYTYRPDLLAHDLYGDRRLWWIFAQRNPDVIKDSIYDFVAGTRIFLPQGQYLRSRLGI
jgi:hypothetical protein